MGKASSSKKVARAAKAGGSKARAAGERNLLFPTVLVLIVVLGIALVVYAPDERLAEAQSYPQIGDHTHMAYGFYMCGEWAPDVPEFLAPLNGGNHTHGDGLFHVHPFSSSRTGDNATIGNWMLDAGEALGGGAHIDDTSIKLPLGEEYIEGKTTCDDVDGEPLEDPIVQIAVWERSQAAVAGQEPDEILTENLANTHFGPDGRAFTIAFMPEGADLPAPPSAGSALVNVGDDYGVDPENIPAELGGEGPSVSSPDAESDDTTESTEPEAETPESTEPETDTTDAP